MKYRTRSGTAIYLYECTVQKHNPRLEWLDEHLSCFVNGHAQLPNLTLLRVCKQIYNEARLIPYAANTFVFIAPPSFEKFLHETLLPAHLEAVRSIAIWSPIGALSIMDEEVSWKLWAMPAQIESRRVLTGLQRLTLNFSIYDQVSLDRMDEVHQLLDLGAATGPMLKKVDLNVTLNEIGRPEGEPEVDVEDIVAHIANLRDVMMRTRCRNHRALTKW
jgi:hypothetical protein